MKVSPVRTILERELKKIGFKRSGSSFVRRSGKVSVFVWIQRSPYAPEFHVNLGAVLEGGPPVSGHVSDWHLRKRAESIMPDSRAARAALDETTRLTDSQRELTLVELIRYADEHLLTPWGDEDYILNLVRHESLIDKLPKYSNYPFRKWLAKIDGRDEASVM
jgi:hypothetical protein